MRILHTANTYAPSLDGMAEVVRNISERVAERGHEVHVATTTLPSGDSYEKLRGVHIHRFSTRGNLALGMYGDIKKYCEFVRAGSWDILVNHSLHVWPTDAVLDQIGKYPWPSVLVTHGLVDEHPSFHEYYSTIPRYIANYFKWIRVSTCSGEASYSKAHNLPTPQAITNGVDMNEWGRMPIDLRRKWEVGRRPWVVNVSNHSPLKNHSVFYELASSLRDSDGRFTLIAGTYPMSKWGLGRFGVSGGCAYQCMLRNMLSTGAVDMKLNLPRHEVVSAIQEADVVVSTSRKEANSLVLLESMAAGTPWVSFNVGSARENEGGIVAANLDEMAQIVLGLLQNPDRRKNLGTAGRAQVMARHDWDSIVDQYEQLYESAMGPRFALNCGL
jgi:L-malate glycosyltransferase